jgi:Rhs element Vgr protein
MMDNLLSTSILIDGVPANPAYQLVKIHINRAIASIGSAELVYAMNLPEDSPDSGEYKDFTPGATVEIQAGMNGDQKRLFKGIVVQQGLRMNAGLGIEMVVHCAEEPIQMTVSRKNTFFRQKNDSTVISEILASYGLSGEVDTTDHTHAQLVQYQSTDWDFIVARADANGLLVYTEGNKVLVREPDRSDKPVLTVSIGENVLQMDVSLDVRAQMEKVQGKVWDFKTQTVVESLSSEPDLPKSGDLNRLDWSNVMGRQTSTLSTGAPLGTAELKAWANAAIGKARMSALQGTVRIEGSALPCLNLSVALKGFSARFNGNALVTSIQHELHDGCWETTLGFGLSAGQEAAKRSLSGTAAGGLLPPVNGLHHGVVKQIDQDPDQEYRILVHLPLLDPNAEGLWARFAQGYAGAGAGSFFYPEIGDEVILGFLNEDPRYPVILGMAYSSQKQPPFEPEAENHIKGFVTRSGLQLSFDDENRMLAIKTPAGNECILSEKDRSIRLNDQNGNSLHMDNNGIRLNSSKDVVINAQGKVILESASDIAATSTGGDIQLEGVNVNASANMALSVTGTVSAEISAAGQTTVKGAMVMIN